MFSRTCLILALTLLSGPALAAGFTQDQGGHYVKIWSRLLTGAKFADASGEKRTLDERFTDVALNLYGEYGLLPNLTAVAFASPVGQASYAGAAQTYVGAVGGGLRYGQRFGALHLALEGRYGYAPDVGAQAVGSGEVDGVPFILQPTVNTHRYDGELQLGVPLSFGWAAASVGVRGFSADGLDLAIIAYGQLGYTPIASLALEAHLTLNQPTGDVIVSNALGAGQTQYLGFGAGATWWALDRLGLHVGADLAGRIQSNAAVPSLSFGLEYRGG